MANYRILGDEIISNDELNKNKILGKLDLYNDNISESIKKIPFTPIGPGKPLTIQIRHLYTGKYPKKGLFDKKKDMLVTSAMKSIATFNAAPRAINFISKDIGQQHSMSSPAATEAGTPIIHYTPALTETNTLLTIEIGFDEFPEKYFDIVGNALSQSAGIPLFMAASSHLIAASSIIKVAGSIGSRIFDKSPVFKSTEYLTFDLAGSTVPRADFRLIIEDHIDPIKEFKGYIMTDKGFVNKESGFKYEGNIPYIIISLDGKKNDNYNDFIPTAASAVLLEKFYNIRDGQGSTLDPLVDAVKVYNDYKFRKKADKLKTELDDIKDKTSKEYKQKEEEYNANISNIISDVLKP